MIQELVHVVMARLPAPELLKGQVVARSFRSFMIFPTALGVGSKGSFGKRLNERKLWKEVGCPCPEKTLVDIPSKNHDL